MKSVIKMSVIQQNRIICQCGSSIKNDPVNIRQHQKTIKHTKYIESKSSEPEQKEIITENKNIVENKDNYMSNEDLKKKLASANALRVKAFRERQKAKLGEEQYKEFMKIQKRNTRTSRKAKEDIKTVEEGKTVKMSRKETKEQIAQYVSNLLSDLDTTKVYHKPAVVQMVKQKLKKFDTAQGAKINCDQLIHNLDKSSLVNSKYGEIKEKSLRDYLANIKLVYTYMTGNEMDCSDFNWARDIPRVYKAIQEMPNTRL